METLASIAASRPNPVMRGALNFDGRPAPHVVLSWGNHPGYIPPPRFSPNQTTFCTGTPEKGARYDSERHIVHGWTGGPAADLGEALRAAGRTETPDLIVVATDVYKKNRMRGLEAFSCPKLLLVGDTHHGPYPLETILTYAQSQKFDAIAIQFALQHAHWFRSAGFERIAWAPGLTAHLCNPTDAPPRPAMVSFVGQSGPVFPRRTRLFAALRAAGLPAFHFEAPRIELEEVLRASPITFNCSINGDLNLRLFEASSAGSLLVTDRLCAPSGFDRLFEPGIECAVYDTTSELVDLCAHYLRHPKEAASIAESGRNRVAALISGDRQAAAIAAWALGDGPAPFEAGEDPRSSVPRSVSGSFDDRLAIYQIAQLLHVERESPRAFIGPDCPAVSALDMTDLPRLQIVVAADRQDVRTMLDNYGYTNRYTVSDRPDSSADWDLWLAGGPVDTVAPTLTNGTVAPLTNLPGVARALNAEALHRYKTPAVGTADSTALHAVISLSGPHGSLNLVTPRSQETSEALKRIFGDRPYSPYPSVLPIRFIVHIGADASLAASFFRPSFPDATILCFDDDAERFRLLTANAAALGKCHAFGWPLATGGIANPALSEAIRERQEDAGIPEIDIVTLDVAGRSVPVVDGLAAIVPTVRSLFVNLASADERTAVAALLEPTHSPWRPQLEDRSPLLRRYIRRDLSTATPRVPH